MTNKYHLSFSWTKRELHFSKGYTSNSPYKFLQGLISTFNANGIKYPRLLFFVIFLFIKWRMSMDGEIMKCERKLIVRSIILYPLV